MDSATMQVYTIFKPGIPKYVLFIDECQFPPGHFCPLVCLPVNIRTHTFPPSLDCKDKCVIPRVPLRLGLNWLRHIGMLPVHPFDAGPHRAGADNTQHTQHPAHTLNQPFFDFSGQSRCIQTQITDQDPQFTTLGCFEHIFCLSSAVSRLGRDTTARMKTLSDGATQRSRTSHISPAQGSTDTTGPGEKTWNMKLWSGWKSPMK
ncbi:hypothetical protein QBC38DRAFT_465975 [Podospora fimiseda]|uniref:Uncharacterized protein n=1 Tax=Podospora fimiseda TaxID=252190 RepID=A0AAN7H1D2_9PEZI|nr:hypothetical protein QBC38DRAFT_465975 [Podospora fimiseda]